MDLGGRDVTHHLMQLLRRAGYGFHTSAEFEIVKSIKERFCYVEPMNQNQSNFSNFAAQSDSRQQQPTQQPASNTSATTFILPDGQQVKLL